MYKSRIQHPRINAIAHEAVSWRLSDHGYQDTRRSGWVPGRAVSVKHDA